MSPGEVIAELAEHAYATGIDRIRFAAAVLEVVTEDTLGLPCHDPRTRLLARRITGVMLEMQWTPPGQEQ